MPTVIAIFMSFHLNSTLLLWFLGAFRGEYQEKIQFLCFFIENRTFQDVSLCMIDLFDDL